MSVPSTAVGCNRIIKFRKSVSTVCLWLAWIYWIEIQKRNHLREIHNTKKYRHHKPRIKFKYYARKSTTTIYIDNGFRKILNFSLRSYCQSLKMMMTTTWNYSIIFDFNLNFPDHLESFYLWLYRPFFQNFWCQKVKLPCHTSQMWTVSTVVRNYFTSWQNLMDFPSVTFFFSEFHFIILPSMYFDLKMDKFFWTDWNYPTKKTIYSIQKIKMKILLNLLLLHCV